MSQQQLARLAERDAKRAMRFEHLDTRAMRAIKER